MSHFILRKGNIFALPILHYSMELAVEAKLSFEAIQPDCVAVELAETMEKELLHAAQRLPDLSVIAGKNLDGQPLYYLCEPCDGAFETLRSALDAGIPAFCIDLDVDHYPLTKEFLPDPYSITHIGLETYYGAYRDSIKNVPRQIVDRQRELYMARRLKELSCRYEKVFFVGGFFHVHSILHLLDEKNYPDLSHTQRAEIQLCTLTEESCREVMGEFGWITKAYEIWREKPKNRLDRQKLIYDLYRESAVNYRESTGNTFPGYHLRNVMKFVRNYALLHRRLMPDLYEILSAAKGCIDHNYAYETWMLATEYPFLKNIDNLNSLNLSVKDIWGNSKKIQFHLKQKKRKGLDFQKRQKDRSSTHFAPPSPFSICSYPPEDVVVESFGEFLKKKGNILLSEESAHAIPFTTSLEEGLDTRETIRHWSEKKLYVKRKGRPPGAVGSVVVIFNEDHPEEGAEKYPWKTTWIGEHNQESDMSFYATSMNQNIVGPGISRCEYGGFMMSYPPRRLYDIWNDSDYQMCRTKAEVLLFAALDYAVKPLVVYVADKPPRSKLRQIANYFGKKIVYLPISQLSPIMLNKIRVFHVLGGHDKREIAGDYIF